MKYTIVFTKESLGHAPHVRSCMAPIIPAYTIQAYTYNRAYRSLVSVQI